MGGDSGYDDHFALIGEKYGPFDLAILESGQYNTMWPLIHTMPEEMAQAALYLKAKVILPVHWGKFRLGMHPWNEPIKRVLAKAEEVNKIEGTGHKVQVVTPKIGELLSLSAPYASTHWWEI